jgi:hypothetical protein
MLRRWYAHAVVARALWRDFPLAEQKHPPETGYASVNELRLKLLVGCEKCLEITAHLERVVSLPCEGRDQCCTVRAVRSGFCLGCTGKAAGTRSRHVCLVQIVGKRVVQQ